MAQDRRWQDASDYIWLLHSKADFFSLLNFFFMRCLRCTRHVRFNETKEAIPKSSKNMYCHAKLLAWIRFAVCCRPFTWKHCALCILWKLQHVFLSHSLSSFLWLACCLNWTAQLWKTQIFIALVGLFSFRLRENSRTWNWKKLLRHFHAVSPLSAYQFVSFLSILLQLYLLVIPDAIWTYQINSILFSLLL